MEPQQSVTAKPKLRSVKLKTTTVYAVYVHVSHSSNKSTQSKSSNGRIHAKWSAKCAAERFHHGRPKGFPTCH